MALNFPDSPTVGQTYIGGNGFTYTYVLSNGLGVWTAAATAPLSLTSPGTISGTASAGSTLTYSTGTATGGTSPYTYAWVWKKGSDNSTLQTGGSTYVIVGSLIGDRVYVALTATDAATPTPATATGNTANYPASPLVITALPFPNLPASLVAGPTQIPQIVSGIWADGTLPITSTGCLQISLDGVTFGQGPLNPTNGATIYQQWAPTGATCGDAPHGTTITGTLTNGTYTNSYSLTLDRNPDAFTLSPVTGQAISTTATSNLVTLAGTNAPAYITYTAGSPNTLTNVKVSIGGGAYVTVPTSGTTVKANPGQTLQFQGDAGATAGTAYTATINVGTTTSLFSVTTSAVVASITTPAITTPGNGTTGINPALNTPSAITLIGNTYTANNGAGATQTSSTFEVYKWIGGGAATAPTLEPPGANYSAVTGSPFTVSASPFNTLSIPQASFTVSSTYYARVKYATTNATAATSSFSAWSSFVTASAFVPAIGTPMAGGYYAGQISTAGNGIADYNLIVAPAASGQYGGSSPTNVQYKTSATGDVPTAIFDDTIYGKPANDAGNDAAHPAFQWAKSLSIGGFSDWYVPAKNELDILSYNLKPDTANAFTQSNPNAVPTRPFFDTTLVAQTTANGTGGTANFRTGGAQAFSTANFYLTSSQFGLTGSVFYIQFMSPTSQTTYGKTTAGYARAIRRVAV
jgi:hypothetical protein